MELAEGLTLIIDGCGALLRRYIAGLLELLEELRLHNRVEGEDREVDLDTVMTVEAFFADFWVFQLLLEVGTEIFVFVSAQVGLLRVRVPEHVAREGQITCIESVNDSEWCVL